MFNPRRSLFLDSLGRWCAFNLVGILGIGIQLASLYLLHAGLGFHYMVATGLAVECAVLHNFLWHEHWTWADRTRHSAGVFKRLARFNLSTGLVSITSNLVFMGLLVDGLRFHYVPANLVSITLCSIVNFLVSDRFVFPGRPGESASGGPIKHP